MSSRAASSPRPSGIPTTVTRAMMARIGRPKNSSSPSPIDGPMRVRPASKILAAPRPTSHSSTSPTTRVDTETASHQPRRPTQPNPSQFVLVWSRLVVPPMVAPDATTGSCWETTSPVTLAPERSSTRPLNTTTSPLTRPEMVTGASKAVRDPSTVPSTVADLLALGDVGAAGEDHEGLAGLAALLRPGGRCKSQHQDEEDCENHRFPHGGSSATAFRLGRAGARLLRLAGASGRSAS